MAKAATTAAPKKKKKKAIKLADGPRVDKKAKKPKAKAKDGFDTLKKLADHPLVADLLAVGAMAAVAAIAEQGFSGKGKGKGKGKTSGSSKAVKDAGKAAAAAIGKRLISEFQEVKKASTTAK